MIAFQSKAEH